jgi:hypothetical protein
MSHIVALLGMFGLATPALANHPALQSTTIAEGFGGYVSVLNLKTYDRQRLTIVPAITESFSPSDPVNVSGSYSPVTQAETFILSPEISIDASYSIGGGSYALNDLHILQPSVSSALNNVSINISETDNGVTSNLASLSFAQSSVNLAALFDSTPSLISQTATASVSDLSISSPLLNGFSLSNYSATQSGVGTSIYQAVNWPAIISEFPTSSLYGSVLQVNQVGNLICQTTSCEGTINGLDFNFIDYMIPGYQIAMGVTFDYVVSEISYPVPEPSTWAMMLLGIGAVGAHLRKHRTLQLA